MKFYERRFLLPAAALTLLGACGGTTGKGERLFRSEGCVRCHMFRGTGTAGIGPDLTGIRQGRSKSWIKDQIENPKNHNPSPGMPAFSYLSGWDRDSLARYLMEDK